LFVPVRVISWIVLDRMEVVKQRALELKGYLDLIQEGQE
jgi:hypothetical protein